MFQTSSMNRSMRAWFASRVDGAPVMCRVAGAGGPGGDAGTTPSCCIIPSMSMLIQPSTSLPSSIRNRRVPLHLTGLLVGGMPMKLPLFTASPIPRPTMRSPSAMTSAKSNSRSGNGSLKTL